MKNKILLLGSMLLLSGILNSQTIGVVTKNVNENEKTVIRLNDFQGIIQWQKSLNNDNWTDISGANSDSLVLFPDTTTYIRAKVTAGNCDPFISDVAHIIVTELTCGTYSITDYDNNSYQTVKIGNQCWTAENVKSKHYSDGTSLIDGTGLGNIEDDVTSKYWFVYNDDIAYADTFGLLYTWAAAMNGTDGSDTVGTIVQGICPSGWHVPSFYEWLDLAQYVSDTYGPYPSEPDAWPGVHQHLKATYGWDEVGTDDLGFTALPGGQRRYTGIFQNIGTNAIFWSSTKLENNKAISIDIGTFHYGSSDNEHARSIRCIKN